MSLGDSAANQVLPGLDYEPVDVYVLDDLDQVRAAATLLRVQILDCLGPKALTVREIGQQLGIRSTQLYYHVGKLEQVGLVQLVHAEVQAGIQQKYFRARAHYYYLSPDLLRGHHSKDVADASAAFMTSQLDTAAQALRRSYLEGAIDYAPATFLLTRRELRMTQENAIRLRQAMEELDRLATEFDDPGGAFPVEFVMSVFPRRTPDE